MRLRGLARSVASLVAPTVLVGLSVSMPATPAAAAGACGAGTVTVTRVSSPKIYLEPGTTPPLNSAYAMYKLTNGSGSAYSDLWVQIGSFAGPTIGKASSESGRAHPGALAGGASANAAFYLTASGESSGAEAHTVSVYTTRPDLASGPLCTASFSLTAEEDIAASANKVTSVNSSGTPQLGGRLVVTVVGSTGTIGSEQQLTATPASYASWPANAYRLVGSKITMSGGNTGVHLDKLYLTGLASPNTDYTAEFTFAVVGTTSSATAVSPMNHISSGTQTKHTSTGNFASLPPIPTVVNSITLALGASPSTLPSTGGTATYTATVTNGGSVAVTLDDLTVALPAGTTYVPGSATYGGVAIGDPTISGSTATFLSTITVPGGGSRALQLQVQVPGTPGMYTATATGHIAAVTIDTTTGTGDTSPASTGITVAGPPPTLTGMTPTTGPADGGTSVTITGTNFTGTTAVDFGTQPAASFTVDSPTTITAVSPAGSGTVPVTVTTPNGTTATAPAGDFTYSAPATPPPAPANETSSGPGPDPQTVTVPLPTDGSLTLLDPDGDPTADPVTVSGQGTYTVTGDTITFTPMPGYSGTATPVTFRVFDKYQRSGDATYTPTVTKPAPPAAPSLVSTGTGTDPQTVTVTIPAGGTATLLDNGTPTTTVTTPAGTYTLTGTTLTFAPQLGFTGNPPPVTYRVGDPYDQHTDGTYQPVVTAPTGPNAANKTTTGEGTALQSTSVTPPTGGRVRLLDNGTEVTFIAVTGQGTYTVTDTGLTFAPQLGFVGTATAVTYRVTDAYNQNATATYTATVTLPPPPDAPDRTTSGVGTTPQSSLLPVPAGGTIALLDAQDNPVTTLTVAGKGTYTLALSPQAASFSDTVVVLAAAEAVLTAPTSGTNANTNATVTFVAQLGYTGTAPPVDYRVTDAYGQTATATYTPTVTLPSLAADPKTSTGNQTNPQQVTLPVPPGGSVTLLDAQGDPVTTLTVAGEGTYTLDPTTGEVSFTPLSTFSGTPTPVTYRVTDAYGQTATATYTPSVVPATSPAPTTPRAALPTTDGPASPWTITAGLALLLAGATLRAIPRPHRRPRPH